MGHARPVVIILVLFFGCVELFTRVCLFRLSKDISRFQLYPERARRLAGMPGLTTAFVGNSATEKGVDVHEFEQVCGIPTPGTVHADVFSADASGITTWYYMINRYFWSRNITPRLVVLPFFGGCLDDAEDGDIGRLAQFFTTPKDWTEVLTTDLPAPAARGEYVTSSIWASYATRGRLKERVLGLLVRDYKGFESRLNAANITPTGAQSQPRAPQHTTYKALTRFLRVAASHGTHVCFVAFPRASAHGAEPVDSVAIDCIRRAGMSYIDLRDVKELNGDCYLDDIHLNARGRLLFTRRLAKDVAPLIARLQRDTRARVHPLHQGMWSAVGSASSRF